MDSYKKKKRSRASRAKRSLSAGLIATFSFFVYALADQYLGIYAWIMGSLAFFDRFLGVSVSNELYKTLGITALFFLIALKAGQMSGKDRPWGKSQAWRKKDE